jgi:hypothetical protein
MTPTAEPLSNCRRRALWCLALALASLGLSGAISAFGLPVADFIRGLLFGTGLGGLFAAALLWFMPDMSDAAPKALTRRYQRQVGITMGAYVLVMLVWKRLLDAVDPTWLKVVIALFPALLVCWVMRAFVQYVRDSDEMQRRIELESGSIAAMLVASIYLGAGFLQSAKLVDIPSGPALIFVFPMLCLLYGIVKIFVARRYL